MTKTIETSIVINASKQTIWKVLTDFNEYPKWNPFIKSVTGKVKRGNQITIKLQGMTFRPKVLTYNQNAEIKWLGHLWFKGLFDGEHQFKLEENSDGSTTFTQNEVFTGILVKLFSESIDTKTKMGFVEMNTALKFRAENLEIID